MKREPLITTATITGLVAAVIALVVAFGVDLSDEKQTAILGVVSVIAPLIVAAFVRGQVTPTSSVVAQRDPDGAVVAGDASAVTTGAPVEVIPSSPGY